jgi:hypothetical protein
MMADHNNFMSFDINSEKDALLKLEGFAKYVMQPLNPVLQDRLKRMVPMRSADESKVNSSVGSQVEGASSGGKQSSHGGISSLQRAARTTLINFANQRKNSFLIDSQDVSGMIEFEESKYRDFMVSANLGSSFQLIDANIQRKMS